jgi:hypothetical protein
MTTTMGISKNESEYHIVSTTTRPPLWEATADFGTHTCKVVRQEDRTGLLTISLTGIAVLHRQPVVITNGGPDAGDIAEWKTLCEELLSNPDRWNGEFSKPGT